ncbi:MAG: plasmid pRiA4b ORF-3 family protein, partial [Moraxellaceae bacterium]|nr:plasmid pRiA4b ORF-3 family protein [Moraxellaceae bacterium]
MTNPKFVKLSDFNFYHNERFRYEYDFGAGWVHEIRVEAFLEKNDKYSYPYCLQG